MCVALHCISSISCLEMTYRGECAENICKYYFILYQELEHLHILVSMGGPAADLLGH